MNTPLQFILTLLTASLIHASEPGFVRTYQPLGGMANGDIHIVPVICVSKHAFNDDDHSLPMHFISMPYLPPSDMEYKQENINQAHQAGISFGISNKYPEATQITLSVASLMSADQFAKKFNNSREVIFTATLECLRLCTPTDLKTARVVLETESTDKAWLEAIITKYNQHDKTKPFDSKSKIE